MALFILVLLILFLWFLSKVLKPTSKGSTRHSGIQHSSTVRAKDWGVSVSFGGEPDPITDAEYRSHWIPAGRQIQIGRHVISNGFIYLFDRQPKGAHGSYDNSAIFKDLPLRIATESDNLRLPYWPDYSRISPAARDKYLTWLADGAKDPNIDLGYVFIYFYGLERRVLVDAQLPEIKSELPKIAEELIRLRSIYSKGSFHGYSSHLLSLIDLLILNSKGEYRYRPTLQEALDHDLVGKIRLMQAISEAEKFGPEDYLIWFYIYAQSPAKYAIRNKSGLCLEILKEEMAVLFPQSLPVTQVKPLELHYRAANYNLSRSYKLDLFDPERAVAGVEAKKLQKQFSDRLTVLSKEPWFQRSSSTTTIIPAVLMAKTPMVAWGNKLKTLMGEFVSQYAKDLETSGYAFVKISDLTGKLKVPIKNHLGKRDFSNFQEIHSKLGFGLDPDPEIFDAPLTSESVLVVYKPPYPDARLTTEFQIIGSFLKIAAAMAWIEGKLAPNSQEVVRAYVNGLKKLNDAQKARLNAYSAWLLRENQNYSTELRKAKSLTGPKRKELASLLVQVSAKGNEPGPKSMKFLQKVYDQLDLDPETVFADVHDIQAGEPFLIKKKEERVSLDPDVLKKKEAESHEAAAILGKVFNNTDSTGNDEMENGEPEKDEEPIPTSPLRADLQVLANCLFERAVWTMDEGETLAREHGLFLSGAIEELNEWAFEHFGKPMVESGDELVVDMNLKNEFAAISMETK